MKIHTENLPDYGIACLIIFGYVGKINIFLHQQPIFAKLSPAKKLSAALCQPLPGVEKRLVT
jgi:hypothetical protein